MRVCFKLENEWNDRTVKPYTADISNVEMVFKSYVKNLLVDPSAADSIIYGEHKDIPGCYSVFVESDAMADLGMARSHFIGIIMLETCGYFNYFVLGHVIYSNLNYYYHNISIDFNKFSSDFNAFQTNASSEKSSMTFKNTIL